jgi:hypothetical protein
MREVLTTAQSTVRSIVAEAARAGSSATVHQLRA